MKVKINKPVNVEINFIKITLCVKDMFSCQIYDNSGNQILDYEGYVPPFIPGSYGDYVELHINPQTGMITNWKKPEDVANYIQKLINDTNREDD